MTRRPLLPFALLFLVFPTFAGAQGVKVSDSLGDLEMAAGVDPYDPAARYNLALGHWSEERYDEAESELRRAVEIDAQFAQAYLALAYLPLAQREELRREILDDEVPEEWEERVAEMDRLYRRAFLVDPLVDLRIMAAVQPKKSAIWNFGEYASFYEAYFGVFDDFEEGNYESAYMRFDRLVRDLKGWGDTPSYLLWYRGLSAAHVGKYKEAVRDIEKLIAEYEEVEEGEDLVRVPLRTNEYRYLLAYVEDKRGKADRAIERYREALVHDVGLYMAHVRLAEIHAEQRDWEESLAERRRAVDSNPDDPTLLTDLGKLLAQMQQWDEAREIMHRAVDANPDDPRPWYFRGMLDQKAGDHAGAREAYRAFLKRAPSRFVQQINDAKARLGSL